MGVAVVVMAAGVAAVAVAAAGAVGFTPEVPVGRRRLTRLLSAPPPERQRVAPELQRAAFAREYGVSVIVATEFRSQPLGRYARQPVGQ